MPTKKTTALSSPPAQVARIVHVPVGMTDEEVASRISQARALVFRAGLPELVANREVITQLCTEVANARGAGEVPDDIWDALVVIDDLVAGKVDRVGDLVKVVVPAYLENLKQTYQDQRAHTQAFSDRMDDLLKQAVTFARDSGRTMVEGLRWRARLQSNARPAVVIHDDTCIANEYRRRSVTMSFEFGADDEDMERYWNDFFASWAGREGFKGSIVNRIATESAYDAWRALPKEARHENVVAGIKINLGEHIRLESGKSKATAKIEPIAIPAPVATTGESQ